MRDIYYHGRGVEGLRNIAETGKIQGSVITDDELFPELEEEIFRGYEKGIWLTKNRACAEIYAWGGGYLEINGQDLEIIDDSNSCYSVTLNEELPIDYVERIMVEDRPTKNRDLTLEVANLLSEDHLNIPIGSYKGETFEIAVDAD